MQNAGEVILVTRDTLGDGERELGEILIKNYFYTLSQHEEFPNAILFLNAGVKLVTNDDDIIDSLKKLENKGTEVAACGTCLNYYGLQESMKVGKVTNMYDIIDKTKKAGKVITL